MSNSVDEHRPSSPLVRHLKQKFDRMAEHTSNSDQTKNLSQSPTNFPKTARVGYDEIDAVAYPLLPVCCLIIYFCFLANPFRIIFVIDSIFLSFFLSLKRTTIILRVVIQRMIMR